ncbi:hypothetical protein EDC04DRAFT_450182 [Pisolithus marmoratus]|nr:hypothetical protein EDC04DRAFT_450182 [Pisolithus marmoratus]
MQIAFFGHQSAQNCYDISQPSYPNAESVIPTRTISSVISDQVNDVPPAYSAPSQGYLEPLDSYPSVVVASGSSLSAFATANMANFPSETSPTHPFPPQITNFTTPEAPQVTSQSLGNLRTCRWRDNQSGTCDELLGWDRQGHLASVHGIVNIAGSTLVTCGARGSQLKRESFLRHFRVVDLGFPRCR